MVCTVETGGFSFGELGTWGSGFCFSECMGQGKLSFLGSFWKILRLGGFLYLLVISKPRWVCDLFEVLKLYYIGYYSSSIKRLILIL